MTTTSSPPPPNRLPWPPMLYLGAVAIAFVLGRLMPLAWPAEPFATVLLMIGVLMIVIAVTLELAAAAAFRKARTTILPHRAASNLITNGPFRYTRNPIYVANTLLVAGAGLVFGLTWLLPAALAAAAATHYLAILREEKHLAAQFGKAWQDYSARVPRWIGQAGREK